jgi:hypothetical protein
MRATVLATSGARYSGGICQFGGLDVTRSTVLRMFTICSGLYLFIGMTCLIHS